MIGNDGGGGKEMVQSSGGRSFQRRGAVMDMAIALVQRIENCTQAMISFTDNRTEIAFSRWHSVGCHQSLGFSHLCLTDCML